MESKAAFRFKKGAGSIYTPLVQALKRARLRITRRGLRKVRPSDGTVSMDVSTPSAAEGASWTMPVAPCDDQGDSSHDSPTRKWRQAMTTESVGSSIANVAAPSDVFCTVTSAPETVSMCNMLGARGELNKVSEQGHQRATDAKSVNGHVETCLHMNCELTAEMISDAEAAVARSILRAASVKYSPEQESQRQKRRFPTSRSFTSSIQQDTIAEDAPGAVVENIETREPQPSKTLTSLESSASTSYLRSLLSKLQNSHRFFAEDAPERGPKATKTTTSVVPRPRVSFVSDLASVVPGSQMDEVAEDSPRAVAKNVVSRADQPTKTLSSLGSGASSTPVRGAKASMTTTSMVSSAGNAPDLASMVPNSAMDGGDLPPGSTRVCPPAHRAATPETTISPERPFGFQSEATKTVVTVASSAGTGLSALVRHAIRKSSFVSQMSQEQRTLGSPDLDATNQKILEMAALSVIQNVNHDSDSELATSFDPSMISIDGFLPPLSSVAAFQGAWELIATDELPNLWLQSFIITGRFYFGGDGMENCLRLRREDGSVLLEGGVLSVEEDGSILNRTGKSGAVLRFLRFELPQPCDVEQYQGVWTIAAGAAKDCPEWLKVLVIKGVVWRAGDLGGILKLRENFFVCLADAALFLEGHGEILCVDHPDFFLRYRFTRRVENAWHRT